MTLCQEPGGHYEAVNPSASESLLAQSRDTRINAMEKIPSLLTALKNRATKVLDSISAAKKAAEKL